MMWVALAAAAVAVGLHVLSYRAWQRAAERLGLHFGEGSFWGDWEIYGEVRGCKIQVRNIGRLLSRQRRFTRITATPPRRISADLDLRPETLLSQATKLLTGQDLLLGDKGFDARVRVAGREDVVYAVLDARTRATVERYMHTWGGQVAGGEVLRDAGTVARNADGLEKLVLDTVRMAEAVQAPEGGYATALLQNLARDPLPSVRRKCLDLLLKFGEGVADEALRVAFADPDPEVMLAAADAAGPRGVELLGRLARAPQVPESVAERALLRLSELDREAAAETARTLLATARGPVARALELAGHLGLADLTPRLVHFTRHPDGALATAAAHGLASLGDPAAERSLVAQLGHAHAEARLAAAEGLGQLGTLTAVQPLLDAGERGALPRKEARAAIARIQARHAQADAGALALVDAAAGGLAVAEIGLLSMSDPPAPVATDEARTFGTRGTARPRPLDVERS